MQKIYFNKGQYYANGYVYDNFDEILDEMKSKIVWLESHNKNYTKEQYYKICDLYNFVRCLEVKENEQTRNNHTIIKQS